MYTKLNKFAKIIFSKETEFKDFGRKFTIKKC